MNRLDTSFVGHHVSSGGFIFCNEDGLDYTVLFLTNKNEWMFPKGHIEPQLNEEKYECALREIEEEVGIKKKIEYSFFDKNGNKNTKEVFVYSFALEKKVPVFNAENDLDILEVKWLPVKEALEKLSFNKQALEEAYEIYLKKI
jgi:8-oxo-dGTP pyrophosphatase MutT (NUDIX family)